METGKAIECMQDELAKDSRTPPEIKLAWSDAARAAAAAAHQERAFRHADAERQHAGQGDEERRMERARRGE